ncbi:ABC transporter ATP-binding protein [Saccharothrix australiensis]|uniref:ABC-type multidrug transport system fused ATPase/permease subunit n=1 Tax=Saccharothrix australiensis TaxID=2072 RepID=A0A495W0Y0_9PSEU|nr:ABC transporter ATP-binding protein [Saccharothrix australiensis]RKT54667.1 ABC-type multidrug transport system fused ATPase/permease subunit [Saccharothrix australiensis]
MRRFPGAEPELRTFRSPGAYLWWLARHLRVPLLLCVVYGALCMVAQALVPAAVGRAVDEGLLGRDAGALVAWGAILFGLGVVQAVTSILRDRCTVTNRLGSSFRTMQVVTAQAARLGSSLARRTSTGEVVNVGVSDVTHIGGAFSTAGRGAGAIASLFVVATVMLVSSWRLGLVVLVGTPVMVWAVTRLVRALHRRQQHQRDLQGALTAESVDIVGGLRVLRGIGGEAMFSRRYRESSQRVRAARVEVAKVEAVFGAAKVLLPGLLTVVIVWLGARLVLAGDLTPGDLVTFYGYAVFLVSPLRWLTTTAEFATRGHVAARRVTDFLALEPDRAADLPAPPEPLGGPLVDPESGLTARPGAFTAVACAATAEATALADRLGGYAGSTATFGGVPLDLVPTALARRHILVEGHDSRLFSGPLGEGLDPADRGRDVVERAVDTAGARDVVEALPDGLDTVVAVAGRDFSGGQRQRLRLARALAYDPDVLVLVEPTSAVDAHTEARIARRLRERRAGRTTVVFTTSPVVLAQAEHVVHVEDGRVSAEGEHARLLANPRYRGLVERETAE